MPQTPKPPKRRTRRPSKRPTAVRRRCAPTRRAKRLAAHKRRPTACRRPAQPRRTPRRPAARPAPSHGLPRLPPDAPVPGLPDAHQSAPPPAPPVDPAPADPTPQQPPADPGPHQPPPGPGPGDPPPTDPPPTDPPPRRIPDPDPPPAGVARYDGPFGIAEATRLLWRAGFGPRRGEAAQVAALGLDAAVAALTRVEGTAQLVGPAPFTEFDDHLEPGVRFEHEHLAWLDRMVRSTQPFVERMALLWHDWFGVSDDSVGQYTLMARHVELFRRQGRGSFRTLARAVMEDGAMLVRLNGVGNQRHRPNENFSRELMELFTLGPDRGAYTERDIREAARGLTGYEGDFRQPNGWASFWFDPQWHDRTDKDIFGRVDDYDPHDVVEACVRHRLHPSFFVIKLWQAFVATPIPADQRVALERLYVESDFAILPVVEAILKHPAIYAGSPLVKQPVVYSAGMLRALGAGIESIAWTGFGAHAGQRLFYPPNISGWREDRWLDTSTLHARWKLAHLAIDSRSLDAGSAYPASETAEQAVAMALRFWDDPPLHADTVSVLVAAAHRLAAAQPSLPASSRNALRQQVLRHLVVACPDNQVC